MGAWPTIGHIHSAGGYLGDNAGLTADHVPMLSEDALARLQDAAIL
ncbi:hypothetical protein ACH4OY_07360 [Micromonospora rubida]|uniref:Uncharacterized protein n=1 Tax=Micromonospora rubida TaxID=2697657 RepID=A0ABW7SFN4_9ACTN